MEQDKQVGHFVASILIKILPLLVFSLRRIIFWYSDRRRPLRILQAQFPVL